MSLDNFHSFPKGFIWGTATSAYQIEGSYNEDGRGLSIWDTFCRQPGKISDGTSGDVAADHYRLWPEDVQIMDTLGLNAYRFSISWPRILPEGTGKVNPTGLDFYDRLVDALLEKEIRPFVTLYHFDLPQALQNQGGWVNRDTAYHFAEYARIVAEKLGDRVKDWITLNEPMAVAMQGYLFGVHAPGIQNPLSALQTAYHLLLAHGLATEALRATLPGDARLGITLNMNPVYPATSSEQDRQAAERTDLVINHLFLEPVMRGQFPPQLLELLGTFFPNVAPEDMQRISAHLDFLGINYYSRAVIRHDPGVPILQVTQVFPNGNRNEYSQMWEIYPPGIYELLVQVYRDYQPALIFITENGIPVPDGIDFDGQVRDYRRIRYLRDHLMEIHRAIQAGVPVGAYFVWSLMDNFEWAFGNSMRFGLVYTDYETQKRIIKHSGYWYSHVIQHNGFNQETGSSFLPPDCV